MYIEKCNICGQKVIDKLRLPFESVVGMAESYTQVVSICPHCGFIFTRNPFDAALLANRYKNNSKFEFDDEKGDTVFLGRDDYKIRSLRQKQFLERTVRTGSIASILEIGAASGYNLSLYDCHRYGIEPSSINCKNAMERYGVDMFCGTFDEYQAQGDPKRYDLIFLSHVLEHIVNPADFIRACSELNTKYMFIEVPTFDYKFADEPYGMFAEEHVNQFTLEGLQSLMNKAGYSLTDAEMIFNLRETLPAGWPALSTIWEKTCHRPKKRIAIRSSEAILDDYLAASKQSLRRVSRIIDAIPSDKSVAVWGTGHHASMLLANTSLGKKNIVCVYDSDTRKDGHMFHNVKIHPFCPQDLKRTKGAEAVVIASYTAQRAIEKAIAPYSALVEVIKLYDII